LWLVWFCWAHSSVGSDQTLTVHSPLTSHPAPTTTLSSATIATRRTTTCNSRPLPYHRVGPRRSPLQLAF
ncbi:Bcl2-like 1, isoform CRA_d, partial [Mus musculus]